MMPTFALRDVSLAAAAACALTVLATAPQPAAARDGKDPGRYTTGDFHNHTTCSDGQISVQKLVNKSVDTYGLDWFIMAGHGGSGNRNCTLVDDAQTGADSGFAYVEGQGPGTTWANSIGVDKIKGDLIGSNPDDPNRRMWRWQSIEEFQYPVLEQMSALKKKPLFVGLEQVVPGHEHNNVSVIDGQLPAQGTGSGEYTAQFEYCFDRGSGDLSRGEGRWDCAVPGSALNAMLDPRGRKLVGAYNSGELGHQKAVEGVKWLQANHPQTSFFVPAHVERAGVFNPSGNNGFNIEHFRNFNNAGPTVAFGIEGGPGHQANASRSYRSVSPGGGTFGGAGYYMAKVGGVWDTLLGEGRNFWIFNNSDYHNRGAFGPDDPRSTNDQYPGEFNKTYVITRTGGKAITPGDVVDGMRSGNAYYVNGDLIDRMSYVVCRVEGKSDKKRGAWPHENQVAAAAAAGTGFDNENCAQQGEKLVVKPGQDLLVMVVLRDPEGKNLAPYGFPNPSLAQIGINVPLNQPVLHHVDLIGGRVTGYVPPGDPRYAGAAPGGVGGVEDSPNAVNPSTTVKATWSAENWTALPGGWKRMFYRINGVQDSQYLRLRGTNMPPGVPNETDDKGNPLLDLLASNVTVTPTDPRCDDAAQAPSIVECATHLRDSSGRLALNFDVEAWTDLWFYSNPVYVEVQGSTAVAGVPDERSRGPGRQALVARRN